VRRERDLEVQSRRRIPPTARTVSREGELQHLLSHWENHADIIGIEDPRQSGLTRLRGASPSWSALSRAREIRREMLRPPSHAADRTSAPAIPTPPASLLSKYPPSPITPKQQQQQHVNRADFMQQLVISSLLPPST